MTDKPAGWVVLGSGTLADEVRAEIAKDPDAYRPMMIAMTSSGTCSSCGLDLYRAETRSSEWRPCLTHSTSTTPHQIEDGPFLCPTTPFPQPSAQLRAKRAKRKGS